MRDRDLRSSLRQTLRLSHGGEPNTAIIDELAIRRNGARIDVALVNGVLHGFELKSDLDTLNRLPDQVPAYNDVCDHVTLVVGERHVLNALELVPDWWGIKVARQGVASIAFRDLKLPRTNPHPRPTAVAQLLRRDEVLRILFDVGIFPGSDTASRMQLCLLLSEALEFRSLADKVRCSIRARQSDGTQLSCGD